MHGKAPGTRDKPKRRQTPAKDKPRPYGKNSPMKAVMETAKTLVTAYGQREAARQLNISPSKMCLWAFRYGWKQAKPNAGQIKNHTTDHTNSPRSQNEVTSNFSPSTALQHAIQSHKSRSSVALGKYTAEASERLAKTNGDLSKTRKAKDLADVHQTIWPQEKSQNLLSIGILIGTSPVTDDPEAETIDV